VTIVEERSAAAAEKIAQIKNNTQAAIAALVNHQIFYDFI
jgi:hypothetical protein